MILITSRNFVGRSLLEKNLHSLDIKHLDTVGAGVEVKVEVPQETRLPVLPADKEAELVFCVKSHICHCGGDL